MPSPTASPSATAPNDAIVASTKGKARPVMRAYFSGPAPSVNRALRHAGPTLGKQLVCATIHAKLVHHEGKIFGLLLIVAQPARGAAMPGLHVHAEDKRIVICFQSSQPRNPFRRFIILNLAVP